MKTFAIRTLLFLLFLFASLFTASSQAAAQDGTLPHFTPASIWFDDEVRSVTVDGNIAYVGMDTRLTLLDVAQPTEPATLGSIDVSVKVSVASEPLIFATSGSRFRIIDVSNPYFPTLLSDTHFGDSVSTHEGLAIYGNTVYLGHSRGLAAIDVSDPYSPTLVGNLLWTLGQVRSVEVMEDPSGDSNRILAYLGTMREIAPGGGFLGGGARIVDVTDPTNMQEIYPCSNDEPCRVTPDTPDLAIEGNYAYSLDSSGENSINGLKIFDLSEGARLVEVGFHQIPDTALYHIAVAQGKSYIAARKYSSESEAEEELLTLDVTDKVTPRQTGLRGLENAAMHARMAVSGPCLYIAQGPKGLKILCDTSVTPTPRTTVWLPLMATPTGS
ncbi:MAG: hypothetical protein J5I90_14615 [Caldilineales bacterium]|nr:hypothetical protein [Caldilineales bacterium]